MSDLAQANQAWQSGFNSLQQAGQMRVQTAQLGLEMAKFKKIHEMDERRKLANESLVNIMSKPDMTPDERMQAMFGIEGFLDTEAGQYAVQSRLQQMYQVTEPPKFQQVDDGRGAFNPQTGKVQTTGYQPYQEPEDTSPKQSKIINGKAYTFNPDTGEYMDAGIEMQPNQYPKPPAGMEPYEMKINENGQASFTFKKTEGDKQISIEEAQKQTPEGMKATISLDENGNVDNVSYTMISQTSDTLEDQYSFWLTQNNKTKDKITGSTTLPGYEQAAALSKKKLEEIRRQLESQGKPIPGEGGAGPSQPAQPTQFTGFPTKHPTVQNPDGSRSNVILGGFNINGKEYMIPTMVDGKKLSNEEAVKIAKKHGLGKYPSFGTVEEANKFAEQYHDKIGADGKLIQKDAQPPQPYRSTRSPVKQVLAVLTTLEQMVADAATTDAVMAKFDTLDEQSKDQFEDLLEEGDQAKIMEALKRMGFEAQ